MAGRALRVYVEHECSRTLHVRTDDLQQPQINRTLCDCTHLFRASQRDSPLEPEFGVSPLDLGGLDHYHRVCVIQTDGPRVCNRQ